MDIKIIDIELVTNKLYANGEVFQINIIGYDVDFSLGEMKGTVHIPANDNLILTDIKYELERKVDSILRNR